MNPGKRRKRGLGTELSKVPGMSKDASSASLRRYSVLPELTTVDSRVCEQLPERIYLVLAASRRWLLANCISLLMPCRFLSSAPGDRAGARVTIKVPTLARSRVQVTSARAMRDHSPRQETFSNFKRVLSLMYKWRAEVRKKLAKVYLCIVVVCEDLVSEMLLQSRGRN